MRPLTLSRDVPASELAAGSPDDSRWAALPYFRERAGLIQIGRIEICQFHQMFIVVESHMTVPECDQPILSKLPQDTIDVNRTQPQRIGEMILRQRTIVSRLAAHPHQSQPDTEFQQKVGHAGIRVAASETDQMLDHHRFIPADRPENRHRQPRGSRERLQKIARKNFRRLDIHDRFDAVIGGVQQDTAQPEKIAGDLEIDDLARSVRLDLVGTNPPFREDIGRLIGLPLMHEIAPRDKRPAPLVQTFQDRKLRLGKGDKGGKLPG